LRDGRSEKLVALFWTIAAKTFAVSQFIDRALHRFDSSGRERLGNITDSAADQAPGAFRMSVAEFAHAPRHLWKEIAGLKLQVILVQVSHYW
jgi:hypothetical protein